MTSKFWIVISEYNGAATRPYRHMSEDAAFTEAQRLTRLYGGKFYVLEAKGATAKVDIMTHRFADDNDSIPF